MSELAELADAIHAWEAARDATEEARKAWLAAQAAQDAALNAAIAREKEAERAAIALMPSGVPDADEISLDGAEGCVIGGRFYLRVGDGIRQMKVANS